MIDYSNFFQIFISFSFGKLLFVTCKLKLFLCYFSLTCLNLCWSMPQNVFSFVQQLLLPFPSWVSFAKVIFWSVSPYHCLLANNNLSKRFDTRFSVKTKSVKFLFTKWAKKICENEVCQILLTKWETSSNFKLKTMWWGGEEENP